MVDAVANSVQSQCAVSAWVGPYVQQQLPAMLQALASDCPAGRDSGENPALAD